MFILEFPQNLLGFLGFLLFSKIMKRPNYKFHEAYVTHVRGRWGAISLSKFIFVDDHCFEHPDTIKHEYGHRIQSKKLLFVYLLIIGIPSLIWCGLFGRYREKNHKSYYWFYTEAWANRLGEVKLQ